MAPPPSPCTARKTIIASMLWAAPHNVEPMRNIAMPISISRRLLNRSASLPKIGVVSAEVSM